MRIDSLLFGELYLSWLPAWSVNGFVAMSLVSVALWACVRLFWGPSQVHGHIGLRALRGVSLAVVLAILLGPTSVDEQPGEVSRPRMLYLLDGSQSMQLGQEETRWEESLRFIAEAENMAGMQHVDGVQTFRFGHRLEPLRSPSGKRSTKDPSITFTSAGDASDPTTAIAPPDATDSRLGDALRQLLPQISSKATAGVVLWSDGRVRASESVERLAEFIGESGVPLHVVPVGHASGNGDIAVVSLVVPTRVRKYTENELQVFLRSYGFTGQRTTVRVLSQNKITSADSTTLASVPITLRGGAQSASLTFRVNEQPEDLMVVVEPVAGELTERNNRIETRVDIDRTKVRVLYIENQQAVQQASLFSRFFTPGIAAGIPTDGLTVQDALQADDDIECIVLYSLGGSAPRSTATGASAASMVFPKTRAELFAFDCVVFSNVGPDVLEEQQAQWLAQWVEGRGGGLIVTGTDALVLDQWTDSPLLQLLPVQFDGPRATSSRSANIEVSIPDHPIWRLRLEQKLNEQLLRQLPSLMVNGAGCQPKSTADVLARNRDDGAAVLMAHRAGRGRVIVSTAALGGRALTELADDWGPQPERVAAKFWRNLIYWVTEGSSTGRRRLVADSDKQFYRPGEALHVFATAYDEGALRTQKYRIWAMFEPASLDDMSLYSPVLWPDNIPRDGGDVGPRIAWGEELPLTPDMETMGYQMNLMLSETSGDGDSGIRIEMTAYDGGESEAIYGHGTQVDSTSLAIQILSDPFEQQNPLPNHELLERLAAVSGGKVLTEPNQLAALLKSREETHGPPHRDVSPAWSKWWLWFCLVGLLSSEWIWRRVTGLA